jgi:amino acid transporter
MVGEFSSVVSERETAAAAAAAADKKALHQFGYAQELARRMHTFQNFAISFSIICILSGGINSFSQGLSGVGGAAVGIGWPVAALFSLCFAIAMAQIGSAHPTAGGLYHWGALLGGRGLGWLTAWFNLIGLVTVLAAINVGTYLFLVGAFAAPLGIDAAALTPDKPTGHSIAVQTLIVGLITLTQALFNHLGIRLTTRLTDLSGYIIFAGAVALTVALLAFAPSLDLSRLWSFRNYSGDAGGGVWPAAHSLVYLFLLGLLLPAYTITGFDASAHTAEETISAARSIPRGMIHAVIWSALFGWVMLSAVILAAPSLDAAAGQGSNSFFWILEQVVPGWLRMSLYGVIALSQYLCGLATVTSASRMMFAFARDGGLPASAVLRQVSRHFRTPVAAIWSASILSVGFTVYAPVYTTVAAVCTIFLYISYTLPIAAGLLAHRRRWTTMGPFDIGAAFKPVALLCILGAGVLLYIGVQPPNDQALTVTIGVLVVSALIWFGLERRRFRGPPVGEEVRRRQAEIAAAERVVGEV